MSGSCARDFREQQLHIAGDLFRPNVQPDVVRADEQYDAARVERKHIGIEPGEQAAARVAADAAVGDFKARELASKIVAPTLRDRVAEEDQGVPLVGFVFGERRAAFAPGF